MYINLGKGIAIYRQNHTKSIYARLRIDKKEIRRTLSTSDIEEAKAKAWQLRFDLEKKAALGVPIYQNKILSIADACHAVIEQLNSSKNYKTTHGDYIRIFQKEIIPYFHRKGIDELTSKNLRLYFEQRTFSRSRLTIHKGCFKRLFLYLEEEELLKKSDFPTLPKNVLKDKSKIGIDLDDRDINKIKEFIRTDEYLNQVSLSPSSKQNRLILVELFDFLLATGIRTGEEIKGLEYGDIKEYEDDLFAIKIRKGKTKNHLQRDVLLSEEALNAIINVAKITTNRDDIDKTNLIDLEDRLIFKNSYGKIADFCKNFNDVMQKMKNKKMGLKHKYTLYSCRHTYITKQLLNGTDMYLVAKQCGNSLEMIQKHYDHVKLKSAKNANKLLGRTELDILNKELADIEESRRASLTDEERALEDLNNMLMFVDEYTEEELIEAYRKAGREYK